MEFGRASIWCVPGQLLGRARSRDHLIQKDDAPALGTAGLVSKKVALWLALWKSRPTAATRGSKENRVRAVAAKVLAINLHNEIR
jgi:hypothetical protein